jgi:divalent metal cation (Fe/Co/Zn/Cd) transporter
MAETQSNLLALESRPHKLGLNTSSHVVQLQLVTIVWMLIECAVGLYSALSAHSPALLAFGSDSFVELLSAAVVLMQFSPLYRLSAERASFLAGILLFVLAGVVALASTAALVFAVQTETSPMGIALTVAALVIMPGLACAKRRAARVTRDRALAADAVQSATCAYLAILTLAGLSINALSGLRWVDPLAAIAAIPILCIEGKRSLRGKGCKCC